MAEIKGPDRELGELMGTVRELSGSIHAAWRKLEGMDAYMHQTRHDIVNQTAANSAAIELLRLKHDQTREAVGDLTRSVDRLAETVAELAEFASRGRGAWWLALTIGSGLVGLGGLVSLVLAHWRGSPP